MIDCDHSLLGMSKLGRKATSLFGMPAKFSLNYMENSPFPELELPTSPSIFLDEVNEDDVE